MANTYDIGDEVRLSVTFTKGATDTDPTTVTLKIKQPNGTESTFTHSGAQVQKEAVGKYYYDYLTSSSTGAGDYAYRWIGTGAAAGAFEGAFSVRASKFTTP